MLFYYSANHCLFGPCSFHPEEIVCDPLGDFNVLASTRPLNYTDKGHKTGESVVIAAARVSSSKSGFKRKPQYHVLHINMLRMMWVCENSVLPSNRLYLGRRLRSKFYSSCFYFESRSLLTPSTWIFLFGWVVVLTSKCSSCIHDIKWRWIVANISKWLLTFE